ncbi:MAG: hypothetical protein LBU46_03225 [Candidatus Accumulibacter sp.]|jgi:hypothetical protein|nr:hypothetical protein [Accumulibacter sp.]
MNVMHENTFRLFCVCCLFQVGLFCSEAGAAEHGIWSYHDQNYEFYSPRLSADNSQLTFVRKRHTPDGHEAEQYSEEELQQFKKQVEINDRFADPEVMLMNLGDKTLRHVDYGWNPAFSWNHAKIYYARQTNPISRYRVLAATLAGNEIYEYDVTRHESAVVAQPASGYLAAPLALENGTIVFALSDAVNGAFGGNIGVGAFDPATGKQTILYKPVKKYNLYHLVKKFDMRDGKCFVLRLRPLTTGTYLADKYADELVDATGGTVLHTWGKRRMAERVSADFRMCPSGPEIYDGGWMALTRNRPDPAQASTPVSGFSSPDCTQVAVIGERRKVTIHSSNGETERRWSSAGGVIRSMSWSPDSSRIVLVISHGAGLDGKFEFDELVILLVRDILAAR